MSIPLNTDNWSGKIKSSKAPANTDVWSGVDGDKNKELVQDLKKLKSSKPVSKFLGLKDGLGGMLTLLPYALIGLGYGIYSGKTVGSKTRRGLFFGFLAVVSVPIIAKFGDKLLAEKENK